MHEAAIADALLRLVEGALPKPNPRVTRVVIVAGTLSGIEDESLRTAFTEMSRKTAAEGAELVIGRKPARLVCRSCGDASDFDGSGPVILTCPKCGGAFALEGGRELYVESIEVEE
jgi:hydrogenase nickel incorporation protein HypA/HybF